MDFLSKRKSVGWLSQEAIAGKENSKVEQDSIKEMIAEIRNYYWNYFLKNGVIYKHR